MNEDRKPHPLRDPCRYCQNTTGYIVTKNGQDVVRCDKCDGHCYNAPKTETGRAVRTVSTIHEAIKPKQRMRIILRNGGVCELCHKRTENLHVGHLLSVERGMADGLTERELNHDENLAAMCDECNLGLGNEPVPLRVCLQMALLRARINQTEGNKEAG